MSFSILAAKLKSAGNLGLKEREPKCCLFCTPASAQNQYNAIYLKTGRFIIEDISKIKSLVVMDKMNFLCYKCPECGAIRPVEKMSYKYAFWWVACMRCNSKNLSFVNDKCVNCDQVARDEFARIQKIEDPEAK